MRFLEAGEGAEAVEGGGAALPIPCKIVSGA